jgi:hypothetical protein
VTDWWKRPNYGGIPTRGSGRVTAWVTVTINAYNACTGCGALMPVSQHTEANPAHLQNEILASQTGANFHAVAHSKTCTEKPEPT